MTERAGVGNSTVHDSQVAGRQAAKAALEPLEGAEPDLVLVFATAGHDQEALVGGVVEVTGDAPLSGCTGEGVIGPTGSQEVSHAVEVMALRSDQVTFRTLQVQELGAVPDKAGHRLAEQVRGSGIQDPKGLLLFPDGLTLNSTPLLNVLEGELPDGVTVVGGLAGEMMEFDPTYQYHDGGVATDALSAVVLGGDVVVDTAVSHGCSPIGLEREITQAVDNLVLEIDGEPAWEVFKEYFDDEPQDLRPEDVVHMCLGERLSEEEAEEYGSEYIVRTPLDLDEESGGLIFPAEFPTGTPVQMTRRDPQRIREEAGRAAADLRDRHGGEDPLALLQFDCAGRGRILFGDRTDEMAMEPVRDAFDPDLPVAGFHTYGEIAPVAGRTRFHNYTVALCALYPEG